MSAVGMKDHWNDGGRTKWILEQREGKARVAMEIIKSMSTWRNAAQEANKCRFHKAETHLFMWHCTICSRSGGKNSIKKTNLSTNCQMCFWPWHLARASPTVLDSESIKMCWTQEDGEKQHEVLRRGENVTGRETMRGTEKKKTVQRADRLFLSLANTPTWPKPNRLPTIPLTLGPHAHRPQNTSLSLLSSSEGRIFVGVSG